MCHGLSAPASSYVSWSLNAKPQVFSDSGAVLLGFKANLEWCCIPEVPLVGLSFWGAGRFPGALRVLLLWGFGLAGIPWALRPLPMPLPAALSHGFLRVKHQVFSES